MWKSMLNFYQMIQKDHPRILLYLLAGSLMKATMPFLSIYLSSHILDALLMGNQKIAISYIIFLLVSNLVLGLIHYACFQAVNVIARTAHFSTEKQTTAKAFVMEYEQFEKSETLDLLRKTKDAANGGGGSEEQILDTYEFFVQVFSLVYALAFTIRYLTLPVDPSYIVMTILSFVFMAAIFVLWLIMGLYMMKRLEAAAEKMEEGNVHLNSMSAYIMNASIDLANGKDIRMYGMEKNIGAWFQAIMKYSREIFTGYAKKEGYTSAAISFLSHLFAGAVFLSAAIRVRTGMIAIADLLLYTGSITTLTTSLEIAIARYLKLNRRFSYLKGYTDMIKAPNMHYDGCLPIEKRDDRAYAFTFRNVSFRYPMTENDVLKNVNIHFDLHKRYAIVGENGAGKTTLVKLLCRLYEPTEGEILLNGINIEKYDYKEYTQIFSVVFQDFKLFPLSLDENIACDSVLDADAIWQTLDQVGMKETVENWPQKEKTLLYKQLGEGVQVSGGEAQKIAIARALYKDAPFVIMDEPTAALDPLAEAEIYKDLNELIQDKTSIFISHRMSSCKFCDEILVFEKGELVQQGSHDELMDQEGLYAQLWKAQAQYYE